MQIQFKQIILKHVNSRQRDRHHASVKSGSNIETLIEPSQANVRNWELSFSLHTWPQSYDCASYSRQQSYVSQINNIIKLMPNNLKLFLSQLCIAFYIVCYFVLNRFVAYCNCFNTVSNSPLSVWMPDSAFCCHFINEICVSILNYKLNFGEKIKPLLQRYKYREWILRNFQENFKMFQLLALVIERNFTQNHAE